MTDIAAAIGLVQLERYDQMLQRRKKISNLYHQMFADKEWALLPFLQEENTESSYHLYPLRIKGFNEEKRDELIQKLAEIGIATNVHYIPIPMFTYYKEIGYSIKDYPNTYAQYENEITLPLYSILSSSDAEYVAENVIQWVEKLKWKFIFQGRMYNLWVHNLSWTRRKCQMVTQKAKAKHRGK